MSRIAHPRADATTVETVPLGAIPAGWDAHWRDLANRASESSAFNEVWFARPSITHLSPPESARMLAVREGPELIGLMPLCVAARYGRMPVRHVTNWLHYHSFLGTPLVRAGRERPFWQAVLAALDAADWAASFLHVNGLVAGGPVLAALEQTRRTDIVHCAERALLASDPVANILRIDAERRPIYAAAAHVIIDVDDLRSNQIADGVRAAVRPWCRPVS